MITRCLQTPGKMRPNHTFSQTKRGVLILFSEDVPRGCLAVSVLLGCGQRGFLRSGSLQGCRVVPVVVKQREPAKHSWKESDGGNHSGNNWNKPIAFPVPLLLLGHAKQLLFYRTFHSWRNSFREPAWLGQCHTATLTPRVWTWDCESLKPVLFPSHDPPSEGTFEVLFFFFFLSYSFIVFPLEFIFILLFIFILFLGSH